MSRLTEAAQAFARTGGIPKSGNMRPMQARAYSGLVDAAREFAVKSDEEWAEDVARLRVALGYMLKRCFRRKR